MNKQTATGLGIAGFVVLIISLVIPYYGLHIGTLALAIVTVGAFMGDRLFTILTVVVSAVKVWFLSPTFALLTSSYSDGVATFQVLAVGAHLVPLIAIFIGAKRMESAAAQEGNETGMPRGK